MSAEPVGLAAGWTARWLVRPGSRRVGGRGIVARIVLVATLFAADIAGHSIAVAGVPEEGGAGDGPDSGVDPPGATVVDAGPAGGLVDDAPFCCVAEWAGPASGCDWSGTVQVTGAGRGEAQARKAALQRLERALGAATRALALDASVSSALVGRVSGLRRCARRAEEQASVRCFAQPQLAGTRICYADLAADPCWSPAIQTVEGIGWQAQEQARDGLCATVVEELRGRHVDDGEVLRCQARCLQSVRVRCR